MVRGSTPPSSREEPHPPGDVSTSDRVILECIETGLRRILGESAEAATLFFVMSRGNLKKEQIPGDPQGFVDAVQTIFGLGSAELLKSILKEIRAREPGPAWDERMSEFARVAERAVGGHAGR